MYKFIGSVMILLSAVFIFSRKVMESYFTYSFLLNTEHIAEKLLFEKATNVSYDRIYKKIGFDKDSFFQKAGSNRYIRKNEYLAVCDFMGNLGKRDSGNETEFIKYNLKNIKQKKEVYYKTYCDSGRVYTLSGFAIGLFIIIILI